MIDKKQVENIVNEYLQGRDLFLVNIKVTKTNVVTVTIDGDNGVIVDDCIELSRHINHTMDKDKEDFELTVTSFGLGEYFTMKRQYLKNIGQNIEVVLNDGTKENGILQLADNEKIELARKKQKDTLIINFDTINKARVLITF